LDDDHMQSIIKTTNKIQVTQFRRKGSRCTSTIKCLISHPVTFYFYCTFSTVSKVSPVTGLVWTRGWI